MIRALAIVAAMEAVASAGGFLKEPSGWKGGPNQELAQTAAMTPHFGGAQAGIEAERYDAPRPGVVLYATRVSTTAALAGTREAEAEFATLAPTSAPGAKVVRASADKAWLGTVEWKDDKAGIRGAARIVIVASSEHVVAARGECFAAADADATTFGECQKALETLEPGIAVDKRVEIGTKAAAAASTSGSGTGTGTGTGTGLALGSASLAEQHPKIPPLTLSGEKPSPTVDPRTPIVGLVLVALAGGFWWNRRRRERYLAEAKEAK